MLEHMSFNERGKRVVLLGHWITRPLKLANDETVTLAEVYTGLGKELMQPSDLDALAQIEQPKELIPFYIQSRVAVPLSAGKQAIDEMWQLLVVAGLDVTRQSCVPFSLIDTQDNYKDTPTNINDDNCLGYWTHVIVTDFRELDNDAVVSVDLAGFIFPDAAERLLGEQLTDEYQLNKLANRAVVRYHRPEVYPTNAGRLLDFDLLNPNVDQVDVNGVHNADLAEKQDVDSSDEVEPNLMDLSTAPDMAAITGDGVAVKEKSDAVLALYQAKSAIRVSVAPSDNEASPTTIEQHVNATLPVFKTTNAGFIEVKGVVSHVEANVEILVTESKFVTVKFDSNNKAVDYDFEYRDTTGMALEASDSMDDAYLLNPHDARYEGKDIVFTNSGYVRVSVDGEESFVKVRTFTIYELKRTGELVEVNFSVTNDSEYADTLAAALDEEDGLSFLDSDALDKAEQAVTERVDNADSEAANLAADNDCGDACKI